MSKPIHEALRSPALIEAMAAIEHERWSHWQRYLHAQCISTEDGGLTIPAQLVERWTRQSGTLYDELSEDEKNSDREQAAIYLAALKRELESA